MCGCEADVMNSKRLPISIIVLALLLFVGNTFASERFIDLRRIEAVTGDAAAGQAKAEVCIACHGAAGISVVPIFPNLAGQRAEYLYWSLIGFQREARAESPMTAITADLADADLRDLAVYFASMPTATSKAAGSRNTRGQSLFLSGDPAKGIPPCQACHGANADGNPRAADEVAYRTYPGLRGQHADYIVQKLKDYRDGKHTLTSTDLIMQGVARMLDDDSMRDIATWLQAMP